MRQAGKPENEVVEVGAEREIWGWCWGDGGVRGVLMQTDEADMWHPATVEPARGLASRRSERGATAPVGSPQSDSPRTDWSMSPDVAGICRMRREGAIYGRTMIDLRRQFGQIDIYLFDQLLRGNIAEGMRVLDAGCGAGRNLVYLMQQGFAVYGTDADEFAIREVRRLAALLAPDLPPDNFRMEAVEAMSFPDAFADVVISSAVLHFARDDEQFHAMIRAMWRVLQPSGVLFCRLASSIGIESQVQRITGRRFALPDGSTRYLVDEEFLSRLTNDLRGSLVDPLKTTVVQNQRSMTTWVVRKNAA